MLVKDFGYWEGGEGPVKSPTGKEINSAAFFSTAVFKAGGIPFPPPQTIPSSHTHSHPGCPPPLLTSVTALYPLTAEVLSVTQDKPCECVVGGRLPHCLVTNWGHFFFFTGPCGFERRRSERPLRLLLLNLPTPPSRSSLRVPLPEGKGPGKTVIVAPCL